MKIAFYLAATAVALVVTPAVGAKGGADTIDRYRIPVTISPEAAAQLAPIYAARRQRPVSSHPVSLADWDRQRAQMEALYAPQARKYVDSIGVTVIADRIGDVPVLRIRPAHYTPHGRTLVYIHGGGYVIFSANSSLIAPALVATASGDEIVSIDYTPAPRGTWRSVTDQVLAVWRGLLAQGVKPARTGMFGDSAGGGLAAGSILKMRDHGLPLPAALWLLSPWADITDRGDSETTLAATDPILNADSLTWGAAMYAPADEQKNPYVSPIYGDYAKAFPPTLVQVGTRELLLSSAVRQYQAIRSGGHDAVLDVYEGMPHVFQALIPASPESRIAITRGAAFFAARLAK